MLQMGMPVAFASESNLIQETKTITAFTELAEDVKNITVPIGTLEEELPLPETVTATVERTVYEETTVDSGNAGEAPAATEETPTTTGEATSLTLGTTSTDSGDTEGVQPKTELVEKKVTEDVNLAVTWESDKPFSSETADTFTYTAKVTDKSYTLGEGVEMPKIMVTVAELKKTMLLAGNAVASTHTLTVTGGIEGVDYQWGGNIYTLLGEVYKAENVLVILTSKALTITGDTKDQAGFKDVISINNGVTANLTLNGVNLVSSGSSAGITIAPGGALNLTLQGTNTFTQNAGTDFRNFPAIRVPEGASLTVTAESTGSLISSTEKGSAVIGGYNKEDCGTVTINGGTFDLSATGAINVEYIGGPAIGPGAYASNGTIAINGGCIKAYSQWGAAIGSGYNVAMGSLIGQENETIVITGGTVVATTDHVKADGIGGFAKAITGGVTITGGSVSTVVQNTRPKSSTQNLYKTTLALDGAGAGVSVSKVSVFLDSGLSETYNTTDMKTDTDGKIYVWLPENAIVTAVIAGGETYTGTVQTTMDDSAVGTFIKDAGSYTLSTGVSEHATSTLSKSTGLKEGDTVILYITPDSGYELKGLSLYEGSVPDAPLDTSGFTKISSNTWSFTMPAGNRNLYVNMTEITDTGDFAVSNDTGCSYAYDSTANTLTFSGTGSATVSMKDGVSTTSERIVFGSGAAVTLTISSLNIASAKGIDVSDTAGNCELILEGFNQISAMDSNDAGVHKGNGTGTLTFSGSGNLNVTMNRTGSPYGSAIGGNKDETVQGLIFNGGNITANGITDGAGIGSNPSRSATTSLTINGGIIRGIGGNYANGIGTGFGRADQITINGGTVYGSGGSSSISNGGICSGSSTVKIAGGSVNMVNLYSNNNNTIFAQPVNTSGVPLYLTTITVGSGGNLSKSALVTGLTFQDSYSYGIHDMYTDDSGKLYLWLPVNTVVTGVTTTYGSYTGSCTTNATEQSNHYLKGTAGETFTIQGTYFTKVTDITLSSNPGLGETDLSSIAAVSPANATNSSITWMVMEAGSTGASISNSKLTLSNGGTYKLQAKITNGATPSTDFIKTFTLSVKQPSYMTVAPASVNYGDTLSVPVSFIVSDALDAAVDTGISGTVKLSKNSDGSSPIATENILDGKGTLVYQTSGKDLAIGDNTLYVAYDGSDTRTTASKMVMVSVKKRPLAVSVTFAEKSYNETSDVKISSAVLSGKLSSDTVTLEDYSSITAIAAAVGVGTQNVTLSGDFIVSGTDADWYELTQPTGLTIEITKATGTASVTMQDWTYGGSVNDPVPTSTTNGTTGVTYQYKVKDAADSTYTATKPTMAGNYTVQATFPETDVYKEVKATADFTITKSATEFTNGIKAYNGDTETNIFTYGDTITVKVMPNATGTSSVTNGLQMLSSFSAPTANQMALFVGEKQITEPVNAADGVYTMTYNTANKDLAIGSNTITAKYVGNSNMVDYSDTVTVTLNKKAITSAMVNTSDASASKEYDGTNGFEGVALTTLTDVESGDTVSAIANGTVTDVNAGTGKTFATTSITLGGDDKDYYSLDKGVVSGNVSITQATVTGVNQEIQVVKDLAREYTFDLTKLLPALSQGKSFGNITYTVGTVTNTGNILAQNPINSDIKDGKITLKVANVTDKDKTATIQIKVASKNYKDFTVDLTVKTIDKTPLTVEAVFTGGTYNGKPYAYTGIPTFRNGTKPVSGITYTAKYVGKDGTTYDESEAAPTNAGKYNLILTVSGESANTYAGTTTIGFEITKKQITAKPNDASIKSNASFPAYTWSIDTGIAGETITATNAKNVVMEAQENGKRLDAVKVGTFDIVFTTEPAFNQNGDIEKNYDIQIGKGKLTVTKHSSGGGSSSGSGSSSSDKDDNDTTVITPPETTENLNPPTKSTATVPSTVTKGTVNVTVSQSAVADAISKAQAEAKKNGTEKNGIAVGIKVDTKNITASSLSINLPKETVDALVKAGVKDVCINSGAATINLNLETLKTIQKEINDDVTISAKKVDNSILSAKAKAFVENRPVFDFTITGKNSKKVKDFGKGKVSVSIPYTLGAKEKAGNVVAYYIDNEGKVHEMSSSIYDKQSKTLMFVTNHFSKYAVGYNEDKVTSFTDIANHWAKEVIEFATARGLLSETEKGKFSPNAVITRGMLVTALGRLAEVDVSSYKTTKFIDVKADSCYLPYIEWASKNGILKGTSETTFAPDQSITREQMAVIMANYAKVMGFELLQVHAENTFADNAKVGSNAKTAVKQMQMAGVLTGKNSSKFDPQGTATRAEVSALLKRFAELVINRNTAEGWMHNDSGSLLYYKDGKAITGKQSIDGVSYEFNKYGEAILKPSSKDETNTTKNETNTTQKKKPNVVKKPTYRTYTVKKGDSFWSIARKFKVNIYTLAKVNKKSIKSTIRPGTVLKIPQK